MHPAFQKIKMFKRKKKCQQAAVIHSDSWWQIKTDATECHWSRQLRLNLATSN